MKKLLLITFITVSVSALAQPTFTSADMIKLAGESYSEYNIDTIGISEGAAGPNQNWNFNITTIGNAIVSNIIAAASAPSNAHFPSADIVITSGNVPTNSGVYSFYEQSTSQSLSLGDLNFAPLNSYDTSKYFDPLVYEKYPFTYLTTFFDSAVQLISAPPGFPFSGSITILENVVYDAYGTLTINNQVFSNVLRRADVDTVVIDFGFISSTSLLKAYSWYQLGNKNPLLVITYSEDSATNLVKSAKINGSIVTGLNYNLKNTELNIYPNPAQNELKISNVFKGSAFYEIKDLSGKTIVSDRLNTTSRTIDIKALSEGLYILELKSNDKLLTKKFVKRS